MAWTGIKVIHDDMRRSTDYVQDPKKTMLENSVDYVFNRDKTVCNAITLSSPSRQMKSRRSNATPWAWSLPAACCPKDIR